MTCLREEVVVKAEGSEHREAASAVDEGYGNGEAVGNCGREPWVQRSAYGVGRSSTRNEAQVTWLLLS